MDPNYWKALWEKGDTLFHQSKINLWLKKYFPITPGQTVFVPLCGKTSDMDWLAQTGHKVVGVELSELAAQSYFEERGLSFHTTTLEGFTILHGERVTIWCGDFFDLPLAAVTAASLIYDRAALIALPFDLRTRYGQTLTRLFSPDTHLELSMLLVALEYPRNAAAGPPFSVSEAEVRSLFAPFLQVELLERDLVSPERNRNPKFAQIALLESVYRLTRC